MKTKILIIILAVIFNLPAISQNKAALKKANSYLDTRSEVQFQFEINDKAELQKLAKIISLDKVEGNKVSAYANKKQFDEFLKTNKDFQIVPSAGEKGQLIEMATTVSEMSNWDKYPTYQVYVDMMNKFATDYPNLCKVEKIGTSVNGRDILAVKISDNVSTEEAEPEFFYSSTLHGDETAGFVLMLRYIDYLLSNYATDNDIKNMVDNIEIYINPNANPDGTYRTDDNTVSDATRGNINGTNLNANYPNPESTPTKQKETEEMIKFHEAHNFVIAATLHGGYELINYPWDAWTSSDRKIADHDWWDKICRDYANAVQAVGPEDYFTQQDNGITHGGDWYVVYGSKQDYANYYNNCREVTIELSTEKLLGTDELNNYWSYHKDAFTGYVKEVLYGFQGTVKDNSGNPIKAKISINSFDKDNSFVYSDVDNGDYYRPIQPGTYEVEYSADNFLTKTQTIEVTAYKTVVVKDVVLDNDNAVRYDVTGSVTDNSQNPIEGVSVKISGSTTLTVLTDNQGNYTLTNVSEGAYTFTISKSGFKTITASNSVSATALKFDFQLETESVVSGIDAPGNLLATVKTETSIALTWNDNSNNETGFAIERKAGVEAYELIASVDANTTTYLDDNCVKNTNYTYKVKATGSSNSEFWRVWIDFNGDEDFDDANEMVFSADAKSDEVTGNIDIPTSAQNTTTRMRVSMKNNSAPTPCGNFPLGEVEDYTVSFGTSVSVPEADFSASITNVTEGASIPFTDQSTYNPTSWEWSFEGGEPATSTSQNPSIKYTTEGTYRVMLKSTNAGGSDTETKEAYITVTKQSQDTYCTSRGGDSRWDWIESIKIGNYENISSNNNGYGNYISEKVSVTEGSNDIVLTPGFQEGLPYPEGWAIWIDFNKDGDFDDAGENVYNVDDPTSQVINATINIPASFTGETRMRIGMKSDNIPEPCESIKYGEVEDYTISK